MHNNNFEFFTYVDNLNEENIIKLDKKVQIIFRNYKNDLKNKELQAFVNFCKKHKRKIYLSNNFKKAKDCGFDGVYIPAFNKLTKDYKIGIKEKFTTLGSAHNIKDLIIKKKQKIDMIFISPLFKNKKNKGYLGIIKFNLISKNSNNKIIALGGINQNNKNRLSLLKINGYAAISYFNK
jgi:thiamine monophosphate synthase